jgi:acid phosphatase type 7
VREGMLSTLKRVVLGLIVVAVVGALPIIALAARGAFDTAAGARPSHAGPKKTPRPVATPTRPPTAAPTLTVTPPPTLVPTTAPAAILVGAGDIASCSSSGDEATATVLRNVTGTVFTLGDNVYDNGTATEYANCYGPSWGVASIKDRTKPVPGNHEYNTLNATGYYGYFGAAAGDPAKGYYAYDHGTWRVYVLNSNCASIGGCGVGSAQEQWLRGDLAANPRACVVAMWHHPLFSSGEHGNSTATKALYQALYEFNAELVLVGHDHDYERFAPQNPDGTLDNARGLVEMVVGTGGRSHYAFTTIRANSLVRNGTDYGVLRLTLAAGTWSYQFLPVAGASLADSGSGSCH